ncbi:MAG: hypothetical protein H7318_18215 [Oligoflexus sp.]|nr:hypothetical protein [Oligoflexus sp.]
MVSVNLIFHIVSAVTFVALIWYLLHLQTQMAFLRELTLSLTAHQIKLRVDWPEAFLRHFAEAYGIRFVSSVPAKTRAQSAPQKIDLKLWSEAQNSLGLESIEWSGDRCRLEVRQKLDLESWRVRLEASFQGKILFELSPSSASSKGV